MIKQNQQSKSFRFKKLIRENIYGWIFVLPLVIGMAFFTFYPMVQSFIFSFFRYNGTNVFTFISFQNFVTMFTTDGAEFLQVIGNTFLYALITVPLNLVLSYVLAVLVNQKIKGVTAYRIFFYLPVVIPAVVSGVIWSQMFDATQFGLFNSIFVKMGLDTFPFFTSSSTALFSVIIMNLWGLGGGMILWLSALKNIPSGLYEAAKIDGAGVITRFLKVTVPLSTPMIFYNLVTGVIGAMQTNATMVYASDGGRGPEGSLYFIAVKIYNEAFVNSAYGYASALAWVLFIIIGVLTAITFLSSKWVYTGDE